MTSMFPLSARRRPIVAAVLGLTLLATGISCDTSALIDPLSDHVPPAVKLDTLAASADSVLTFNVHVEDNLGILSVQVDVKGDGAASVLDTSFSTTFTSNETSVDLPYTLAVPTSIPRGTNVTITASALDGARNASPLATLILGTGHVPPSVVMLQTDDSAVVGKTLSILLVGKAPNSVFALGYIAGGSLTQRDSVVFANPLKDSTTVTMSLSLQNAKPGTLTITPFLIDSMGKLQKGSSVNVTVLSTADANTVPRVSFGIGARIEATDTIHVEASDLNGIDMVGYIIQSLSSCSTSVSDTGTFQFTPNQSPAVHTFPLQLSVAGCQVAVKAFARNSTGATDTARATIGGTVRVDTVTVVAGTTTPLPSGGVIADAVFHDSTDNLYLTNIEKNEVEVFHLSSLEFDPTPILVGSRPWGITVRPADNLGGETDTLLVANSGGTNISFVKVDKAGGAEVARYALPNFGVYTVTTTLSKETGQPIPQLTKHEFSDRPQYIAATCQTGATSACSSVVLVYSTSPTPTQSTPFSNRGSIRWENLTTKQSHFFFEQAMEQAEGRSDTLEIVRYPAAGVGTLDTLVSKSQNIVVNIDKLAFRDTTFVRNSGNFQRVIIGEGGAAKGSRAMYYDVNKGFSGVTGIDAGISPPQDVDDIIGNAATNVRGVSINFDGALSAIRGDSTYIVDPTLRLQGILETSSGAAGFDFHPLNKGYGSSAYDSTQVAFAASSSAEIQVYNTYTFRQVCTIPIRDPIIGPIKAATRKDPGTSKDQIVLVGATVYGVVVVTLPSNFSTTCSN